MINDFIFWNYYYYYLLLLLLFFFFWHFSKSSPSNGPLNFHEITQNPIAAPWHLKDSKTRASLAGPHVHRPIIWAVISTLTCSAWIFLAYQNLDSLFWLQPLSHQFISLSLTAFFFFLLFFFPFFFYFLALSTLFLSGTFSLLLLLPPPFSL